MEMEDNIKMDVQCTQKGTSKSDHCYLGYDRRMTDICKHGT